MTRERNREIAARGGRTKHDGPRGFALLSQKRRTEIATQGGRASARSKRG